MLKHSIRFKLTGVFFIIIVFMLISICIINSFGLEMFYRMEKVKEIQNAYESINTEVMDILYGRDGSDAQSRDLKNSKEISKSVQDEDEDEQETKQDEKNTTIVYSKKLSEILVEYSNRYNISIIVVDPNDKTLVSTERYGELIMKRIKADFIGNGDSPGIEKICENERYGIILNDSEENNSSYIEFLGYCSDENIQSDARIQVMMSTPIANLKTSVLLSNKFLLYIGIFASLYGMAAVFLLMRRVTKPILELADISEKICLLDFNARYDGRYEDEIGILGRNMNLMSGKLKHTIDELMQANIRLQAELAHKEQVDEMRRDFIANVSHELKTPIALIQGYAEGLSVGLCEDEESRKYYTDVIMDEASKMNLMVKQLLTLSALESGTATPDITEFDMNELVEGVMASTKILLGEKKVNINIIYTGNAFVKADEFKIEEVLTNYVSNAINHVDAGGYIEVKVEKFPGRVKVSVFNTGGSIPEDDIEHIWEKFYKVDKAHSRGYGGSGIGLSIVKAIIEAHGGSYGVRNRDNGVEFWFELGTLDLTKQ